MNATPPDSDSPRPCSCCQSDGISRRRFFARISYALGGLCAAAVTLPGIGFIFAPLFRRAPEEWRTVGKLGDFKVGETTNVAITDPSPLPWAGVAAKTAAWLRRVDEKTFIAFAVNCSHLGCPVRWLSDANLFMCPCHGGVYYSDGRVAAGPPPRALSRYEVRIVNDEVQILTQPIPIA